MSVSSFPQSPIWKGAMPSGRTYVYVRKCYSRVLDHNLNGLDDCIPEHFRDRQFLLVKLALGLDLHIAGQLSEALSSSSKNVVRRSLGICEQENNEDWSCQPDNLPQSPSPSFGLNGKRSDDWTESWAPETSSRPC